MEKEGSYVHIIRKTAQDAISRGWPGVIPETPVNGSEGFYGHLKCVKLRPPSLINDGRKL